MLAAVSCNIVHKIVIFHYVVPYMEALCYIQGNKSSLEYAFIIS